MSTYTPDADARCAVCECPADQFNIGKLVESGAHQFNIGRRSLGNDPVCSPDCLASLRAGDH